MNEALTLWLMTPDRGEEPPSLEALLNRPEWHRSAACRGVGAEAFVPRRGAKATHRELCSECPVRQECLRAALADPELVGVWAGTTERERRDLRRSVA